jgi:hypothetical protein
LTYDRFYSNEIAKLIVVLSPAGMEQLVVDIGLETSNNSVKTPPPFNNEQKQKLTRLASNMAWK